MGTWEALALSPGQVADLVPVAVLVHLTLLIQALQGANSGPRLEKQKWMKIEILEPLGATRSRRELPGAAFL